MGELYTNVIHVEVSITLNSKQGGILYSLDILLGLSLNGNIKYDMEVIIMKKMNETTMKKSNGGWGYRCVNCGVWFPLKYIAGYHILWYNHRFVNA
jgi:hypothetical protein